MVATTTMMTATTMTMTVMTTKMMTIEEGTLRSKTERTAMDSDTLAWRDGRTFGLMLESLFDA